MSSRLLRAIVKTLSYSDIFDYPLTLPQLKKYLIGFSLNQNLHLEKTIKSFSFINFKKGYYYFTGRQDIVGLRIEKEKISRQKLKIALTIARLLFHIPTIKMIAITGNLALLSSDKKDDIDFLIITRNNRMWTTRFLCVLYLKIIGAYRKPKQNQVTDKICLNMFLEEDHLSLPVNEQDLYSAHEIIQMKPLFTSPGYENIILKNNLWVKKFLPNAIKSGKGRSLTYLSRCDLGICSKFFDILEFCAKRFQLFYMRKRRTTEVIKDGYLRFHPHDARHPILQDYQERLKKYLK